MNPFDLADLRKVCIKLSMNLNSSYHDFVRMGLFDLLDLIEDYNELMEEENRRQRKEAEKYR